MEYREMPASYYGKGKAVIQNNGKSQEFASIAEFESYCIASRVIPKIIIYTTDEAEIQAIRKSKSRLVEAIK